MDYVLGGVAALISGNVTPNRPKALKRALTPMKHQPSPNVTPKSESVLDRNIFLSPTTQKKKAIVKKSPKRIFQNTDLDLTCENEGNSSLISPKADKVKKHLKDELDADNVTTRTILSPKSPKNKPKRAMESPSKKEHNVSEDVSKEIKGNNESKSKKKKKKLGLVSEIVQVGTSYENNDTQDTGKLHLEIEEATNKVSPKKRKKSNQFTVETIDSSESKSTEEIESNLNKLGVGTKKNNKKNKSKKGISGQSNSSSIEIEENSSVNKENEGITKGKKNKKNKKKVSNNVPSILEDQNDADGSSEQAQNDSIDGTYYVNPNAITHQDTDSEHESDDDIESEDEVKNRAVLDTGPKESSDDEEEEVKIKKPEKNNKEVKECVESEEEVKRTLFVGNVPFSSKCKNEIKKLFDKYGEIETVRIRTVPVKDARVTPKVAVIKNELHPDRSTVNVYIKYVHPSSVNDALVENNTLHKGNHLRVARSDTTGREHDPRCAIFVGNLPFAIEDEALRARFERCGQIESVRIVRDRKTNAGKGFGYVNFASKDGVELALALTEEDLTIKNRILRVKRCTQLTTNKQGRMENKIGRQQNNHGRLQNNQGGWQNNQRGRQHNQGNWQHSQGNRQNYQGRLQNQTQGRQFNSRGGQPNIRSGNQFANNRFQRPNQSDSKNEGAYRRLMNKRQQQESNDGPPEKRARNPNEQNRLKKPRKEFVGMTAGKKKFQKRKLNKDQMKKKALSEILTKQQ